MAPRTRSKIGSVSSFCFFSSSLLYSTKVCWSSTISFCQSSAFFCSAACESTVFCLSISSFCFWRSVCRLFSSCWRLSNTFFRVACARSPSSDCMTARWTSTTAIFICAEAVAPKSDTSAASAAARTGRAKVRIAQGRRPKEGVRSRLFGHAFDLNRHVFDAQDASKPLGKAPAEPWIAGVRFHVHGNGVVPGTERPHVHVVHGKDPRAAGDDLPDGGQGQVGRRGLEQDQGGVAQEPGGSHDQ